MTKQRHQQGFGSPRILLVPLLFALLFGACKDDQVGGGGGGSAPGWYPISIGKMWQYDRIIGWENIRIIDSSAYTPLETVMLDATVQITRNLRLPADASGSGDSIDVVEFRTEMQDNGPNETFDYYEQTSAALLQHGYIGSSITTPRSLPARLTLHFAGEEFSSIQELWRWLQITPSPTGGEIIREFPPLIALAYPLVPGNRWTYRPDRDPFRIDKTVVSVVDTLIGFTFQRVTVVRWQWDFDHNGVWDDNISMDDYFTSAGLVRRILTIRDVVITSSSGPDPIAMADMTDDLVLR